jgi:hypothetical protein
MKLKGVNPLEQHIEKIVVVLVAAIFLIVLAAQFLREPNQVRIGNHPPVPPGDAFHRVKDRAETLRERMRTTNVELPEVPSLNIAEQFLAERELPVAPPTTIAALGLPPRIDLVGETPSVSTGESVVAMKVPAPKQPVAWQYRGTVDPFEVKAEPRLAEFLPAQQPFDMAAVTVEARFDGQALRSQLMAGGADGTRPMPAAWWREGVQIVTLSLEREELTDGGEWSGLTVITSMPGRVDLMPDIRRVRSPQDLSEIASDARTMAEDILRPTFVRLVAGPAWEPPADAARAQPLAGNPEIDRRVREREGVQRQIEEAKEQLAALGGGDGEPGPGGRPGPRGAQEPPRQPDHARRQQELQRRISGLELRLANIDEQLQRLGWAPPRNEVEAPVAAARPERSLLENPSVRMWVHDLSAQPGRTYRYRMIAGINNPAFGRQAALGPDQQELAARPVLLSTPSEWSAPVQVLDDTYFFVRTAHEASQLGQQTHAPPRAGIDVFQFFYGYHRLARVQLEPGDVVTAQVTLPDSSRLLIFDVDAAPDGDGGAEPGDPNEQRINATQWTAPVVASIDCFLLDVAGIPGSGAGSARTVAYLRGENGGLMARFPDVDSRNEVYQRVLRSAREGELQGEPAPEAVDPVAPPPPRGPRGPRPDPGGAGGGGSG